LNSFKDTFSSLVSYPTHIPEGYQAAQLSPFPIMASQDSQQSSVPSSLSPSSISSISPPDATTILQLQQQISDLQNQLSTLLSLNQQSLSNSSSQPLFSANTSALINSKSSGIKVATLDNFDGSSSKADTFLTQLALYFHGKRVSSNDDKVILALSYMKGGTAGPWAKLKVKEFTKKGVCDLYTFVAKFQETFGDPNPAGTARHKMNQLRQGNHSADKYVASFRELKNDTRYNTAALIEKFEQGLNPVLANEIYALPEMPTTLDSWISWAIKLDRQWRQKEANKKLLGQFP
jgi:TolA-binding protein